jgi:nucleoside-diphosphate-sugar epimerase
MAAIAGSTVEPVYDAPRPGDGRDSQADIRKARALLGYSPIVSFEEGLTKTLEWCRQQGR